VHCDDAADTIGRTIHAEAKTAQVPGIYPPGGTKARLLASFFHELKLARLSIHNWSPATKSPMQSENCGSFSLPLQNTKQN
jgi:hypothetical protein